MKGLYIHIPFCRQKCKYCDFVSYSGKESMADKYIDALHKEALQYTGEKVDTIFIGGGTPSILSPRQILKITDMCFDIFDISPDYEFTAEVNPGTINDEKAEAMLKGGINRISVGVQSFNDDELKLIGRIHDGKTAYNTVCHLENMGFKNISIDLMTALPNQTMKSLKNNLETAISLPLSHISAYSLIIEDGTVLKQEYLRGELNIPDEDEDREMYEYTVKFLKEKGFMQYEISNFAKEGRECRHNIKYWTGEKYIGLGAAAHSYDGDCRYYNTSDIDKYISGSKREVIKLTESDKIAEFMITGLRMNIGISKYDFKQRFRFDIENIFGDKLSKFIKLGLVSFDGERYSLTDRGINVSNGILCEFV